MDRIPIHWLHTQAFCEYEIFLSAVRLIPDPNPHREDIEEGKLAHNILLAQHNAVALPTDKSIEELAHDATITKASSIIREVLVIGERMVGRIDEVELTPDGIYVIEDKPRHLRDPFISEKRQAQGYAMVFREVHAVVCPIIAVIRDRDTQDWLWQKPLDNEDMRAVNESLDRIIGILTGSWEAVPTRNENKCHYCRWNVACDKRA